MALQISGKCLDVTVEIVGQGSDSFEATTIHLLSGEGAHTRVEQVRVGRDYPRAALPKRDEQLTLNVFVTPYAGRNGAGYRLTAVERVGHKLPAPAGA